jgi:hypothetical protein
MQYFFLNQSHQHWHHIQDVDQLSYDMDIYIKKPNMTILFEDRQEKNTILTCTMPQYDYHLHMVILSSYLKEAESKVVNFQ